MLFNFQRDNVEDLLLAPEQKIPQPAQAQPVQQAEEHQGGDQRRELGAQLDQSIARAARQECRPGCRHERRFTRALQLPKAQREQRNDEEHVQASEAVKAGDLQHPVFGSAGMVAAQNRLSAEAGAEILAAGGNAVALTRTPRRFCYGPHPTNPQLYDNANMISAADMRNVGLYQTDPDSNPTYTRARLVRSLSNYYRAKRAEVPRGSTFGRIVEHERRLRHPE